MVRVLDLQSTGCIFNFRPPCFPAVTLPSCSHVGASVTRQYNLVQANEQWRSKTEWIWHCTDPVSLTLVYSWPGGQWKDEHSLHTFREKNGPQTHIYIQALMQTHYIYTKMLCAHITLPLSPFTAQLVGWDLVVLLLFNGIFSTNRLNHAIAVWNISGRAGEQDKHTIEQWNNGINQEDHTHSSALSFWRWSPRHGYAASDESL